MHHTAFSGLLLGRSNHLEFSVHQNLPSRPQARQRCWSVGVYGVLLSCRGCRPQRTSSELGGVIYFCQVLADELPRRARGTPVAPKRETFRQQMKFLRRELDTVFSSKLVHNV